MVLMLTTSPPTTLIAEEGRDQSRPAFDEGATNANRSRRQLAGTASPRWPINHGSSWYLTAAQSGCHDQMIVPPFSPSGRTRLCQLISNRGKALLNSETV